MTEMHKRRRLAAITCFQPYLNQAELVEAIRILDLGYQTDSPTALISYVKLIADQHGIDVASRKALHGQFYQLLQQPLAYLESLSASSTQPPPPTAASETTPVAPETKAPSQRPPHVAVFAQLAEQIVTQCAGPELLEIVDSLCQSEQRPLPSIACWQARPDDYDWAEQLEPATLKALVHYLYTAVCELRGPIEADSLFHEALAICQKQPEAKLFSPGNFF